MLATLLVALSAGLLFRHSTQVAAASTITVDSTTDDGSGGCTLREAIQSANTDIGVGGCTAGSGSGDTIAFNIAGAGPHTIQPTSALPNITTPVIIDGYTETGAIKNTAVSPAAFNGTLMIEIDGQSAGALSNGLNFNTGSAGSRVSGLVINRFNVDGIKLGDDNLVVSGNYIGTDQTGMVDQGNGAGGVQQANDDSDGAVIGGLNPEDRNIISGNQTCGISPNTNSDNWLIQGNYIGVNSAGTGTIGNGNPAACGGISLDNSNGHIIGGSATGARNVISGNFSHGIGPSNADNVTIQGNYIGVLADGTTAAGNGQAGATHISAIASSSSDNLIIIDNITSNTIDSSGMSISTANGARVQGNTVQGNGSIGISVGGSSNVLIGGTNDSQSNIVSGNGAGGIFVSTMSIPSVPLTIPSTNVSLLRNKVYNNSAGTFFGLATDGVGIDLLTITLNGSFVPTGFVDEGVTPNDAGDTDDGPNYLQNFPVITDITTNGDDVTFTYNLDVNTADPGVTGYRVEFFANAAADATGFGEGQTFVGADTGLTGDVTGRTFTVQDTGLTSGTYAFSSVTTATDNSADGFASSSEFSADVSRTITGGAGAGTLADTGRNQYVYTVIAIAALAAGVLGLRRLARY